MSHIVNVEPIVRQPHDDEEGTASHDYLLNDSSREPNDGEQRTDLVINFAAS